MHALARNPNQQTAVKSRFPNIAPSPPPLQARIQRNEMPLLTKLVGTPSATHVGRIAVLLCDTPIPPGTVRPYLSCSLQVLTSVFQWKPNTALIRMCSPRYFNAPSIQIPTKLRHSMSRLTMSFRGTTPHQKLYRNVKASF